MAGNQKDPVLVVNTCTDHWPPTTVVRRKIWQMMTWA